MVPVLEMINEWLQGRDMDSRFPLARVRLFKSGSSSCIDNYMQIVFFSVVKARCARNNLQVVTDSSNYIIISKCQWLNLGGKQT